MQPPRPENELPEPPTPQQVSGLGPPLPPQPPPSAAPQIPDHEMLRCIGEGSYGEVWLARNALGSSRAVKVVYRDRFENEKPFDREFAGIRRFEPVSRTHDGFVDILQVGRSAEGDWFYYVMELADDAGEVPSPDLPGGSSVQRNPTLDSGLGTLDWRSYAPLTFASRIHAAGRLAVADCVRIGLALTAALDHLHRHDLVHRDIKPSNIIFVNGQPKLADVGLVAETSEAHSFVGTQGFIPPEGPGSVRADLYALGKVLYAASTGHGATAWPNPLTDLGALPDQQDWLELNEVINTACHSDPKCRYASAAEMQADLALLQIGKSLQRQRRLEKRLKQAAWALAAGAVVVGSVLFVQQLRLQVTRERAKAEQTALQAKVQIASVRMEQAERGRALLELEQAIRPPHREGWSTNAWQMASNAAAKFGFDTNLQSQAAASLAGLDAKLLFQTNGVGGSSVAFDREGKRVLFGSLMENTDHPGKAHLLDLVTTNLSAFPVPGEGPVAFLPDGTPVQFSADASHRLALWIVGQRVPPVSITPRNSPAAPDESAQTSPPGNQSRLTAAATVAQDADAPPIALRTFTLGGGERIGAIESLAMTSDGALVAASGTNTSGRVFRAVWDGATGELRSVAASRQSAAELPSPEWRRSTETPLREPPPPPAVPAAPATALALTSDGSLLAAGNDSGEVTIWHVSDGSRLPPITAGRLPILSLAFCRDFVRDPLHSAPEPQWLLAVGDSGGGVTIWEVPKQQLRTPCQGAQFDRSAIAFSPDGTLLASAGRSPMLLWDTATGYPVVTVNWGDMLNGIAFSSDGEKFAATWRRGGEPAEASVWAIENGRGIRTFRGLSHQVTKVRFSADAKLLAAVAHDWQVGLWDLSSDKLLHVFNMPRGLWTADNSGLAFSPDGSQFAFMAGTNATLLAVKSGLAVRSWQLPPGYVEELAFNPAGHLLAFHVEPTNRNASEFSRPIVPRIRDLSSMNSLEPLIKLPEFNSIVRDATWSPDGSYVVIEGVGVEGRTTNRWVKAVSPYTSVLWKRDSRIPPSSGAVFTVDAAGDAVAYAPGPSFLITDVCNPVSGTCFRQLSFMPEALSLRAGLICGRNLSGGLTLSAFQDESTLTTISISGTKPSHKPTFSRDGRWLAWGNEDGTVSVCDLGEMQQRLSKSKLGWQVQTATALPGQAVEPGKDTPRRP